MPTAGEPNDQLSLTFAQRRPSELQERPAIASSANRTAIRSKNHRGESNVAAVCGEGIGLPHNSHAADVKSNLASAILISASSCGQASTYH